MEASEPRAEVRTVIGGAVTDQLIDAWHTVVPPRDNPHGPLPGLLVAMTVVTGLVDAFSYLQLGRVFVANMTGNVVFLSFALGGVPGFLWWASILAVAAFLIGATLGGRIGHAHGAHRGRHLLIGASLEAVLMLAAFLLALIAHHPYGDGVIAPLIVVLGIAMGVQNATARGLGVPDLTTTVLTMTLTGISADSPAAGGSGSRLGRRAVSVISMFLGGLLGALLVHHQQQHWVLAIAAALLLVVVAISARCARSRAAWVARP